MRHAQLTVTVLKQPNPNTRSPFTSLYRYVLNAHYPNGQTESATITQKAADLLRAANIPFGS